MAFEPLVAALQSRQAATLVAALQALDSPALQAFLARTRVIRSGPECTLPELGHNGRVLGELVLLFAPPTLPKAAALRSEIEEVRLRRVTDDPLPLPAEALRGWPAATRVELERVAIQGALDLRDSPSLETLFLSKCALEGLILPKGTIRLILDGVSGITALAGLDAVDLYLGSLPDLTTFGPLHTLPRLQRLGVRNMPALASLDSGLCPSLHTLHLADCPRLESLDGAPASAWTTEVKLENLPISSLHGLAPSPRVRLEVKRCGLRSLAGLPALTMSEWRIEGESLATLDGIEPLERLTDLTVEAPALADLSALTKLPALAQLTLVKVPLSDLSVLRGCKTLTHLTLRAMDVDLATLPANLRGLDLRGNSSVSDVSPLVTQTDLRALALHGTSVPEGAVPPALTWASSWEKDADLGKLARRARPKPGARPKVDPALLADLLSLDVSVVSAAMLRIDSTTFEELLKHGRSSTETTHPLFAKHPQAPALLTALVLHAPFTSPRAQELRKGSLQWKPGAYYSQLWPIDAARLATFQGAGQWWHLQGVRLTNAAALQGMAVRSLQLENVEMDEPSALAGISGLQSLTLAKMPVNGIVVGPEVKTVYISDAPDLRDPRGLAGPNVAALHIRTAPLATLEGIEAFPALESLDLNELATLDSLAPLARLSRLNTLSVHNCRAVRSLAGVPPLERLSVGNLGIASLEGLAPSRETAEVDVRRCEALTNVVGIQKWSGITMLTLRENPSLVDLGALADHPTLRGIDLRESRSIRDLAPLATCPNLRAIMTSRTGIDVNTVPSAIRWACSDEPYSGMEKLMLRIPPTPAVATSDEGHLHPVSRLLRAPQVESVDQGLELLQGLGDPSLWDALLDGAELEASSRSRTYAKVVSRRFSGTLAPYVLLGLLHSAPETCARAQAIRAELRAYTNYGTRNEAGRRPVDPRHFEGLPVLERIQLDRVGPFVKKGEAPSLPALTDVYLQEVTDLSDLWWLARAPNIERLTLRETPVRRLDAIIGAPKLRELSLMWNPLTDWSPLLTLPALTSVTAWGSHVDDAVKAALTARGVRVS